MFRRLFLLLPMLLLTLGVFAGNEGRSEHGSGVSHRQVTLILEDHGGMREVVWDAAFPGPSHPVPGPFMADHRYALVTGETPSLVNLGCWDAVWPQGNNWKAAPPVPE